MKKSILDEISIEDFRKQQKLQPFRIKQIYHEIFKNSVINFDDMTTLSKELREDLKNDFEIISLKSDKVFDSKDSCKMSFITKDNHTIESVLMYHFHEWDNKKKKLNRITICLSSQIWCAMWCSFCVTGKLWFKRNLEYTEIIEQILFANNFIKNKFGKKEDWTWRKIRNVVFMWMWEPLLNYDNIKKAVNIMLDQKIWFSLSRRHITISTCGIIPWIKKLIQDKMDVKLAISLHAPNQELRESLMPIAKTYKLDELMETIDEYVANTDNRIFYEYIMIDWITDTPLLAQQLAQLLRTRLAHVNLIAYNQNPAIDMKESLQKNISEFKRILEQKKITVTVRDSLWRDVKGACWQLGYENIL